MATNPRMRGNDMGDLDSKASHGAKTFQPDLRLVDTSLTGDSLMGMRSESPLYARKDSETGETEGVVKFQLKRVAQELTLPYLRNDDAEVEKTLKGLRRIIREHYSSPRYNGQVSDGTGRNGYHVSVNIRTQLLARVMTVDEACQALQIGETGINKLLMQGDGLVEHALADMITEEEGRLDILQGGLSKVTAFLMKWKDEKGKKSIGEQHWAYLTSNEYLLRPYQEINWGVHRDRISIMLATNALKKPRIEHYNGLGP